MIITNEAAQGIYGANEKTLYINQEKINQLKKLGFGVEGRVYAYSNTTALKIFYKKCKLHSKLKKITALLKHSDEAFCFPIGLVDFNSTLNGYLMKLVETDSKLKTFFDLKTTKNQSQIADCLLKAEAAMMRVHKKGIYIGDIRGENIMIDKNQNPIFVDTDNYSFEDYDFDIDSGRKLILVRTFKKNFSKPDCDKLLFSTMSLQSLLHGVFIDISSVEHFKRIINKLNTDKESKEVLDCIFSDSENKPYISSVLKKINATVPVL